MAVARIRSVSEQTQRQAAKHSGVSVGRVAQADTVLRYAPEQASGDRTSTAGG
jgi:hypothetical protein